MNGIFLNDDTDEDAIQINLDTDDDGDVSLPGMKKRCQ